MSRADTQAMPVVSAAGDGPSPADPAAPPSSGEPTRWGTGRTPADPVGLAEPAGDDPDAPFRPPHPTGA